VVLIQRLIKCWPNYPLTAVLLLVVALLAPPAVAADTDDSSDEAKYLRVVEDDDGRVSLEIAVTRFESDRADTPSISLVGVAHIGEDEYYDALQELLDQFDVVLFESVMPAGVNGPQGDSDEARAQYTHAAMTFVWSRVLQYKQANGDWPDSLDDVRTVLADGDSRYVQWFEQSLTDGWGRPLRYTCQSSDAADEAAATQCMLISYGADGEPGGEEHASDITSDDTEIAEQAELYASASDDNLQSQLADALGLEFQLDSIDYSRPHWVCSDMTVDELNQAMDARGLDFSVMGGTLAGTSLPARIVKVLLRLMSAMDAMLDGAIADIFKLTLIEMLGDERIMDMSMKQFGEGFGEVIIGERNQVVMNDLGPLVEKLDADSSIAVFYGAGHLADFEQRFEQQLGYTPTGTQWLAAMTVDMQASAVSESQLRQMRIAIRRALYQSMAGARR